MSGYLANYGAGHQQREKRVRRLITLAVIVVVVGGTYLLTFKTPLLERYLRVVQILKNGRQEREVETFLDLLRKGDYKAAYALWGCTEAKPCRDYPMANFMEDWGPHGAPAVAASYQITKSRACGSGVILTLDSGANQEQKLWVEREDPVIGFSPWPGCPAGR
jgi:hypothetical protein